MMDRWGFDDDDQGTATAVTALGRAMSAPELGPASGSPRPDLATATRRLLWLQQARGRHPQQRLPQREVRGIAEGGQQVEGEDILVGQKQQQQRDAEGRGGHWAWMD